MQEYELIGAKLAKALNLKSQRFQEKEMSKHAQEEIEEIKLKDRSHMKVGEWDKRKHYKQQSIASLWNIPSNVNQVPRIDGNTTSVNDFIDLYDKPNLPCIITNLTAEWKIDRYWTWEEMYKRYGNVSFKIGEDDNGKKLRIPMKYYLEYLIHNTDDSPLYLFESSLEDLKEEGNEMINRFQVHKYFLEDLFALVGEKKRPPYRWFLMGPTRSGTTVHLDPLETSAWNTSIAGHKLWVLFPPHLPKCIVKGKDLAAKGLINREDMDESIDYFLYILPKLLEVEGQENLQAMMCIQGPGDTIFVPGGWWHGVVNLNNTMALTQNVMSKQNFDRVWRSIRQERKKFSYKLLMKFKEKKPEFYERAIKLNQEDQFKMKVFNGTQEPDIIKKVKHCAGYLSSDTEEKSSSSSSSSSSESESSSSES